MGARAFLAGRQDVIAVGDPVVGAEAALLEEGPVDVAHLDDVGEVDVLGLHPRQEAARVFVGENAAMDVVVARPPAAPGHVHPAAGTDDGRGRFAGTERDLLEDHLVLDAAAHADLPGPRGQGHVQRPGHAPERFVQRAGEIGGAGAAGVALLVELGAETEAVGGLALRTVGPREQLHHGGGGLAGVVREHGELEPAGRRGGDIQGQAHGSLARPPELERQRSPSEGNMLEARDGKGGAAGRGVQRDEARFTGRLRHIRQARCVAHALAPGQHFEQQRPGVARQFDRPVGGQLGMPARQVHAEETRAGLHALEQPPGGNRQALPGSLASGLVGRVP